MTQIVVSAIFGFIFAYILFRLKQRDSFITGILESRINAAQEAYSQSLTISKNIHSDGTVKSVISIEFETWFRSTSLKLPKEIRDILRDGMHYLSYYNELKDDWRYEKTSGDAVKADEKYNDLKTRFNFIAKMPYRIEEISDKLFNRYMVSDQLGVWWFIKNIFK